VFVCLFVYLFVCVFVCLLACLLACLFVCVQVGEINSPDAHGFDLMVFRRGFLRMVKNNGEKWC
jgi:hypothetical protein